MEWLCCIFGTYDFHKSTILSDLSNLNTVFRLKSYWSRHSLYIIQALLSLFVSVDMTLSIEYTFQQTLGSIYIKIPKGKVSISKSCITVTDLFIRLSSGFYHLELDLLEKVEPSTIRFTETCEFYQITLKKLKENVWSMLTFQGSKDEIQKRREDSQLRRESQNSLEREMANNHRWEEERMTLRFQMQLDKEEMNRIQDLKSEEKVLEEQILHESIEKLNQNVDGWNNMLTNFAFPIRQRSVISFEHSRRFFNTPIRESNLKNEHEYMVKHSTKMKHFDFTTTDNHEIDYEDISLLKSKGDEMYACSDFLSAINIYSDIIIKDPTFVAAYANRGACYLRISEPRLCISDCQVLLNFSSKLSKDILSSGIMKKNHLRLASAYFQLDVLGQSSNFERCLRHLDWAKQYAVHSFAFSKELELINSFIKCKQSKRQGDKLMQERLVQKAIAIYTNAIQGSNGDVVLSLYINRATAFATISYHDECVHDCNVVLNLLSLNMSTLSPKSLFNTIPQKGRNDRKRLVSLCLAKRAYSYFHLKRFNASLYDLEVLSKLHKRSSIKRDIIKIRELEFDQNIMKLIHKEE